MVSPGFPLENLEKWKGIFQSGKSQGILNRLEKSGKITQNTGTKQNIQQILEKWKKYWKSRAILSVRKSGNHVVKQIRYILSL